MKVAALFVRQKVFDDLSISAHILILLPNMRSIYTEQIDQQKQIPLIDALPEIHLFKLMNLKSSKNLGS